MEHNPYRRFTLRSMFIIIGVLALVLFTQMTVSHADPFSPQGASTLGDFVWHDSNVDGQKESSTEWDSSGIDGVVVKLYEDDLDGVFEPGGDDTLFGTLTTGDNSGTTVVEHGWYDFVNVTFNGKAYWVVIDDSNFQSGGALEGYVYTGNLGSNNYNGEEPRFVYVSDAIKDYDEADFSYAKASVELVKTAGDAADGEIEYVNSGDSVVYHYKVTNTGETHLSDIDIVDDNGTPNDTSDDFTACHINGPLAPGASQTCDYTVSNVTADVTNTAKVTANPTDSSGTDLPGEDATDTDDAEVVLYASLGDYVWEDMDADGVQDANESGIGNVTVNLLNASGSQIDSTTTDPNGAYSFDNLVPGDYIVEFVLPTGYNFSPKDQGNDDADSDADTSTGKTDTITLTSGENDDTWDAGMYKPASLGDYVWWDLDEDGVQDADEPGLEGVTVTLKDSDGNVVDTDTTDANGAYTFDDLDPGDYTVEFTLPGSDWSFSPQDNAGNDTTDSDADPNSGEVSVDLSSGENDDTVDAGMTIPSSYTITKENTSDNFEITPGDPVSFTITIKNTGKTWLGVVPLKDEYDTNYLTYVNANPASDDNNDDGTINWSDLTVSFGHDLAPGDSFSVVVNFTAKAATDQLTNQETINTATAHDVLADPDGPNGPNDASGALDDQSDDEPVNITNPVGIDMADFSAHSTNALAVISWKSDNEATILGYNLLRQTKNGSFQQVNDSLIFARYAGAATGTSYQFVDTDAVDGHSYMLEIVLLDGSVEQYGITQAVSWPIPLW